VVAAAHGPQAVPCPNWSYSAGLRATPAPGWAVESLPAGQPCNPPGSLCTAVVLARCIDGDCTDESPSVTAHFVDVTPPVITAMDGPHAPVIDPGGHATLTFAADGPATFACSLDGGPEAECSSPLTLGEVHRARRAAPIR
jgi:hypothetical protein